MSYHELRVSQVIDETHDTRSFVLEIPPELRERFAYRAGQYLTNSLIVVFSATLLAMLIGTTAAYGLVRFPVRGGHHFAFGILALRMFPTLAIAIPPALIQTLIFAVEGSFFAEQFRSARMRFSGLGFSRQLGGAVCGKRPRDSRIHLITVGHPQRIGRKPRIARDIGAHRRHRDPGLSLSGPHAHGWRDPTSGHQSA